MPERELRGTPASPGVAFGVARQALPATSGSETVEEPQREAQCQAALAALAAAADALSALAARLPAHEGEILEAGALMARDPALMQAVRQAALDEGLTAGAALLRATGGFADAIAQAGDDLLAARADDVRSLGRRAALLSAGGERPAAPGPDSILVAADLGPADVAELSPPPAGFALAAGSPTAHAAIVARSLGIPMATGLGPAVLGLVDGTRVVLDGGEGTLVADPDIERVRSAAEAVRVRSEAVVRAREQRERPATTRDGRTVTVMANVASPEELRVALDAGAEGIGLLRTELAFLDATSWPSESEHVAMLERVLADLGEDRPAVVRVLDFGADKSPPFLLGTPLRGLELLLAHTDAFAAQLRALAHVAQRHDVRILLPMVEHPTHVIEVRRLMSETLGAARAPQLGAMIETSGSAEHAREIAGESDFLSIGTNDLTASLLGADRFAAHTARAHHPVVLQAIAHSVRAAHAVPVPIEVCGEAASDPIMLPLLVGFGVDELSVGASRVGEIRQQVRALHGARTAELAQRALGMSTPDEVELALARAPAPEPSA